MKKLKEQCKFEQWKKNLPKINGPLPSLSKDLHCSPFHDEPILFVINDHFGALLVDKKKKKKKKKRKW